MEATQAMEANKARNKRVLVTGTDGYIGSVLAPVLLQQGYDVIGLDTGYYREGWLFQPSGPLAEAPRTRALDIRLAGPEVFEGCEAVIHLAELSNDPLGENRPEVTMDINHAGSVRLARLAREAGVSRFIYASSCSVYGARDASEVVNETSPTDPRTAYARCKVMVEQALLEMADERFCPVVLRNATVFGASPRMRFDIVLNDLTGRAWTRRHIQMISDGTPWRPLVHVQDVCAAVEHCLRAPRDAILGQIFNVGSVQNVCQVRDIASVVASVVDGCELSFGPPSADDRSYNVNFAKILDVLPGFQCKWDIERGARELVDIYRRIGMTEELFTFRAFTRLKALKHLQATGQLDPDLYWRTQG
jgi:nucleoside-diphosphate-sugar epimerase